MIQWPYDDPNPPSSVVSGLWGILPKQVRKEHDEQWRRCVESVDRAQATAFITQYRARRPKTKYQGKPEYWNVLGRKYHPLFSEEDEFVIRARRDAEVAGDRKFLRELRKALCKASARAAKGAGLQLDTRHRWLASNWLWIQPREVSSHPKPPGLCWYTAPAIQWMYERTPNPLAASPDDDPPRYWQNLIHRLGLIRPKTVLAKVVGTKLRLDEALLRVGEHRE